MSDEELRELERATRANPHDLEKRLAYASALERRGERRLAHLELAHLAREGHALARERLRAWTPRASLRAATHATPRAGLRGPAAIVRDVDLAIEPPLEQNVASLPVVTDDHALLARGASLACVRLDELSVAWVKRSVGSSRDFGIASARGGDFLFCGAGNALVLLDPGTGDELARAPLAGPHHEAPDSLQVAGDRAFLPLAWRGEPYLVALDVGRDFGRMLWQVPIDETAFTTCGETILLPLASDGRSDALEARLAEDGSLAWRRTLERGEEAHGHDLVAADEHGIVLARQTSPAAKATRAYELGLDATSERWSLDLGRPRIARLDERTAFLLVERPRETELVAIDRATGRVRWSIPGSRATLLALATDTLYAAWHDGFRRALTVAGYDALSGERLFEVAIPGSRGVPEYRVADLVPLERGLLVLGAGSNGTRLILLG